MADTVDHYRRSTTPASPAATATTTSSPPGSPTAAYMGKSCSPLLTPKREPDVKRVQRLSPAVCNGYGSGSSPTQISEDAAISGRRGSNGSDRGEDYHGYPELRHHHHNMTSSSPMDMKMTRADKQRVAAAAEHDQNDAPLDFSVKRRDSISESFTDDSRASSSVSPPNNAAPYSSALPPGRSPSSSSRSPHPVDVEHHHAPRDLAPHQSMLANHRLLQRHVPHHHHHQHHQHQHHHHHERHGDGEGRDHGRSTVGRSPGSSPDLKETSGSPRVPNASLAALGMMAEGGGHGGGGVMTPAAMAAMLGQNGSIAGPLGSLSTAFLGGPGGKMPGVNGGKVQRPFKMYPKEVLQMPLGYLGLPGMNPFSGVDQPMSQSMPMNQDDVMSVYKKKLDMMMEKQAMSGKMSGAASSPPSATATSSSSSSSSTQNSANGSSGNGSRDPHKDHPHPPIKDLPHPHSTPSYSHSSTSTSTSVFPPQSGSSSRKMGLDSEDMDMDTDLDMDIPISFAANSGSPFSTPLAPPLVSSSTSADKLGSRKRPRTFPETEKDEAYWERRRKNNDAAKRSRDARRAKEDEIALRAALLEQENLKLRVEVAALRSETHRLRCLLYNT